MSATSRTTQKKFVEAALRALAVICLSRFLFQAASAYESSGNVVILLQATSEFLTIALIIIARMPIIRSTRPLDVATTIVACYFFLFFADLDEGRSIVALPYPPLIQLAGVLLQIYAKASLGRSFGLLPANRGIVQSGPYQWVRHPIYLGYLITHIGFVLGVFSWYNLLLIVFLYVVQGIRVTMEEKVLRQDPAYHSYCEQVKWRIVPGVF